MRQCEICGRTLPEEDFSKSYKKRCKDCVAEMTREKRSQIVHPVLTEEPVSNNYNALIPCIYNRTLEERIKYCKYCSAACNGRFVEEPASEDLEKEIKSWIPAHIEGGDEYLREVAIEWSEIVARHFAEWGRNHFEDKSEIVSEDLEKASWNYSDREGVSYGQRYAMQIDFKAGADWQQKQDYKRFGWHDAKKEQPPMDEEVIVLTNVLNGKELSTPRRICFGHIVDKEICVDYDGWNIPGVAYWMYDPKLKEVKKS